MIITSWILTAYLITDSGTDRLKQRISYQTQQECITARDSFNQDSVTDLLKDKIMIPRVVLTMCSPVFSQRSK